MNKAKPEDVNIGLVGFRITRILTDSTRGTGSLPPPPPWARALAKPRPPARPACTQPGRVAAREAL